MGLLTWILVGLIAGWLAGQVMKGGGYGVLVDIILGIVGGVIGGWVFGALGNLARRRHHRRDPCGICWRGDFGMDYPLDQKSLKKAFTTKNRTVLDVGNHGGAIRFLSHSILGVHASEEYWESVIACGTYRYTARHPGSKFAGHPLLVFAGCRSMGG